MLKKITWLEWLVKVLALIGLLNLTMRATSLSVNIRIEIFEIKSFELVFMSIVTVASLSLGIWQKKTNLITSSIFPLVVSLLYLLLKFI